MYACSILVTLRCTAKLLERLKVKPEDAGPSANRLGDWYANTLFVGRERLVLLTSSVTLLPVLVTLKESKTLVPRFAMALAEMLAALGISGGAISAEIEPLTEVVYARTASRRVLGSMNDFAFMFEHRRRHRAPEDLLQESLDLAKSPCSPIGMASPDDRTRAVLSPRP